MISTRKHEGAVLACLCYSNIFCRHLPLTTQTSERNVTCQNEVAIYLAELPLPPIPLCTRHHKQVWTHCVWCFYFLCFQILSEPSYKCHSRRSCRNCNLPQRHSRCNCNLPPHPPWAPSPNRSQCNNNIWNMLATLAQKENFHISKTCGFGANNVLFECILSAIAQSQVAGRRRTQTGTSKEVWMFAFGGPSIYIYNIYIIYIYI